MALASYEQDVVVQPLGELCLIRVLEEPEESGGVLLPKSYTQGEGRSLQGVIVAVGLRVTDPDILRAHHEQATVLFDDTADAAWWKGGQLPNYLGAVLNEGEEYVLVPAGNLMLRVDDEP